MHRDLSNPRWVAVVDSRRVVDRTRQSAFKGSVQHTSSERNLLIGEALTRHLAAVVGLIVADQKDPDQSMYVIELRKLVAQRVYPYPPILPDLPGYEEIFPRVERRSP